MSTVQSSAGNRVPQHCSFCGRMCCCRMRYITESGVSAAVSVPLPGDWSMDGGASMCASRLGVGLVWFSNVAAQCILLHF